MNAIVASLTDIILSYLLFASLIAVISIPAALVLIKLARIRAAVHQHMVWWYTLVIITILPAICLYCPKLTLAVLPERAQSTETTDAQVVSANPSIESVQSTADLTHPSESTHPPAQSPASLRQDTKTQAIGISTVLAGLWLLGVIFMLSRLAIGWIRFRKIRLSATTSTIETSGDDKMKVLLSSKVEGPVCFGLLPPVIMLPRTMVDNVAEENLNMILTHEFAHIERRDHWINIFQRLIEAVFFFHPLIWYASFRLTQQREHICDNYVLASGVSATDYVEVLHRIAEWGSGQGHFQAVALFEGRLLARVNSMFDSKHSPRTKSSVRAKIACAAGILLCVVLVTVRLDAKSPGRSGMFKEVTVNVTDVAGAPVAGAAVEALADYTPVASGRTDKKGQAILKVPQESVVAWVIGLKAGTGFDYYENYSEAPFRPALEIPEQINLVLNGARTIRIKAVDKSGRVLSEVPFVPWTIIKEDKSSHVNLSGSSIARVLTNREGVAEFDWFAADTTEQLKKDGAVRPGTSFLVRGNEYYWPEYMTKPYNEYGPEVTVRLLRATTISGRVLLPDGRGAAGITVRAEGRGSTPFFCRRTTYTAADGSYRLSVPPNQMYMVTVVDEKWASKTKDGIIVREDGSVENVDLRLVEGTLIHGRVILEKDAAPAVGQTVFLGQIGSALPAEFLNSADFGIYSKKQTLIRTAKTDEQGNYTFRAGPGDYMLGSMTMVDHNDGSAALTIKIESQGEITHDLRSGMPAHIADLTHIGVTFAHQEEVYDGTMVFTACDYCHWPVNKPSKPHPAEPEK